MSILTRLSNRLLHYCIQKSTAAINPIKAKSTAGLLQNTVISKRTILSKSTNTVSTAHQQHSLIRSFTAANRTNNTSNNSTNFYYLFQFLHSRLLQYTINHTTTINSLKLFKPAIQSAIAGTYQQQRQKFIQYQFDQYRNRFNSSNNNRYSTAGILLTALFFGVNNNEEQQQSNNNNNNNNNAAVVTVASNKSLKCLSINNQLIAPVALPAAAAAPLSESESIESVSTAILSTPADISPIQSNSNSNSNTNTESTLLSTLDSTDLVIYQYFRARMSITTTNTLILTGIDFPTLLQYYQLGIYLVLVSQKKSIVPVAVIIKLLIITNLELTELSMRAIIKGIQSKQQQLYSNNTDTDTDAAANTDTDNTDNLIELGIEQLIFSDTSIGNNNYIFYWIFQLLDYNRNTIKSINFIRNSLNTQSIELLQQYLIQNWPKLTVLNSINLSYNGIIDRIAIELIQLMDKLLAINNNNNNNNNSNNNRLLFQLDLSYNRLSLECISLLKCHYSYSKQKLLNIDLNGNGA